MKNPNAKKHFSAGKIGKCVLAFFVKNFSVIGFTKQQQKDSFVDSGYCLTREKKFTFEFFIYLFIWVYI